MKKLTMLLLLMFLSLPVYAKKINPPKGFEKKVYDATYVVYGSEGEDVQGICTATAYEKTPDGYNFITAGHCLYLTPAGLKFSVASQIGEPGIPATVVKAHMDDNLDMMVLHVVTDIKIPTIPLDLKDESSVGDKVMLVTFGDMIGKQISNTVVSTGILDDLCDSCEGKFALPVPEARGASGSAIISMKSHKIVGILVLSSKYNGIVQPASDFNRLAGIQEREIPNPESLIEKLLNLLHN